jgi:sodium-dependent dicarboxylate transporter 2/3/5
MADSRVYGLKLILQGQRPKIPQRIALFLLSLGGALLAGYVFHDPSFSQFQNQTLFLIFFAIFLWITEAVPPFAVSIFIIGFLVYSQGYQFGTEESVNVQKYVNTWSSSVIWLMLGGFFLARGMEKTKLDYKLFEITINAFGTKPNRLLLGLMLTTAVGSMIMSNTATTAMMMAAISPIFASLNDRPNIRKAFLLGIPAAASVGGMGTIIGSPPNAIALGALNNEGYDINFLEWMIYGVPIAMLLTFGFWLILVYSFKLRGSYDELNKNLFEFPDFETSDNDIKLVLFTIAITIGLWLTSPIHHFAVAAVSGLPIILLTLGGVITADDMRALPWDTLMLVAGGLALGIAIVDTGLASYYLNMINEWTSQMPVIPILIVLGVFTMIFSNIMSNTATSSILIPLAILVLPDYPIVAALVIGLSASTALFLPISTPPNAIAFSTGFLKQKDFRLGGLTIGITGPLLITLWIMICYALMN